MNVELVGRAEEAFSGRGQPFPQWDAWWLDVWATLEAIRKEQVEPGRGGRLRGRVFQYARDARELHADSACDPGPKELVGKYVVLHGEMITTVQVRYHGFRLFERR